MTEIVKRGRGRPPKEQASKPDIERKVEIACKRLSEAAIQVLEEAIKNPRLDMKIRITAAKEILDRGWGKPRQSVDQTVQVKESSGFMDIINKANERAKAAQQVLNEAPPKLVQQVTEELEQENTTIQ